MTTSPGTTPVNLAASYAATGSSPTQRRKISVPESLANKEDVQVEGYAPKDRFLWDSWVLEDNGRYRLYHLDAPEDPDPDTRHDRAQIRTAVSDDLIHWNDEGLVVEKGPAGSWDDKAIWTGNAYKKGEQYFLFYTGRNERDGQTQRIGLATSTDGKRWQRSGQPLLEADARWYETDEPSPIYKAWRDPAVVQDPESGKYHMFFTAKTKDGDPRYKGCIGMAVSDNFEGPYQCVPPILAPGQFAQMECPQVIQREGKTFLFFSSMEKDYNPSWAEHVGGAQSGLHCYVGDSLNGPFRPVNGDGLVTRSADNLYSVKILEDSKRPGEYQAIGWYMADREVAVAKQAACAAIPGPAGPILRIVEKGCALSPPFPVLWNGEKIEVKTGRQSAVSIGS
jgi:beta-fructofuranosidase